MRRSVIVPILVILICGICSQVCALDGIGINPTPGGEVDGLNSTAGSIIGTMQWIGYALAIIMMVYIGIKYITSSADDKASLKGTAWKYVLGAVLITSAVTIANWIYNLI